MSRAAFDKYIDGWLDRSKPRVEGFVEAAWTDRSRPAWRALDVRYDQCVGHFECTPERNAPDIVYSVHFSCLHDVHKPGWYESESDFLNETYTYAEGHTRYWFLRWYATYVSAHGRFPPPYYTGPQVPGFNDTHDTIIHVNRFTRN